MAKKIICSVISFILCAVIAFLSCYFAIPNFNAWVNGIVSGDKAGDDLNNKQDGEDNDTSFSGGSAIGDIIDNGVTLLSAVLPRSAYKANGVSEQAETAYTLTAEVTPDYASDKMLDWAISWQNSESEWASGKEVTDYVTITPTVDGASTAVCSCLQDFGEPVILTVSSRSNPEISGFCYVHYYQRVKSCELTFSYDGEAITPVVDNGVYKVDYTGAENDYNVELKPVYSNYTLTDTYTTTVNGSLSSTFGYTATESLTSLRLPAGLSGGDPELTENALNWCNYLKTTFFEFAYGYDLENLNIGADLLLGNNAYAHGQTIKPKYKLTEEEKNHPRCAYYISLIESNRWQTESAFNQLKTEFYAYQPSAYNFCGAQISTYNNFVLAVKRCNDGNVGVVQYSVTINGEHSSYQAVFNLGYNDEFKINVQDINLSDTSIAF